MNESQTEFEYIDPALREAGWGVVEGSKIRKQFPITQGRLLGQGRKSQPLKADYLLEYKNRKLAIIEAKKRGVSQIFLEDPLWFSEQLIYQRIVQFQEANKVVNNHIFFDRGIPDVISYLDYIKFNWSNRSFT